MLPFPVWRSDFFHHGSVDLFLHSLQFENEDDKSIEELFGEVTAKWEPRRVEFLQRVAEVEDSEVREALQSRIAHYDQVRPCVFVRVLVCVC